MSGAVQGRRDTMGRSLVDSERSESVRRRVYLPDVDEFRSSSGPLSGEPGQPPRFSRHG